MGRLAGYLLCAFSGISFGAMAVLARFAYDAGADPYTTLVLRFGIAAVALLAWVAYRRIPLPRGRVLLGLLAAGGLGLAGVSLTYFLALTEASAGLVSLLHFLYPALVALVGAAFYGERPGPIRITALVIALGGTALTVGSPGEATPLGIFLAVLSAVIFAAYFHAANRLTEQAGSVAATTVTMVGSAAVFAAMAGIRGPSLPSGTFGWLSVVALALVSTALAYGTLLAGMRRIGPTPAAMLSTLEPVVTVVLAAAFLGENLGPLQLGGGALIVGAALLLAAEDRLRCRPRKDRGA
jgi:drug/metabolite transporter (DMT)-like permease